MKFILPNRHKEHKNKNLYWTYIGWTHYRHYKQEKAICHVVYLLTQFDWEKWLLQNLAIDLLFTSLECMASLWLNTNWVGISNRRLASQVSVLANGSNWGCLINDGVIELVSWRYLNAECNCLRGNIQVTLSQLKIWAGVYLLLFIVQCFYLSRNLFC